MPEFEDKRGFRSKFRSFLVANPNYFGNLSKLDLKDLPKPVFEKTGDTHFEELTCIGFDPETDVLCATVRVKQQAGYSGGPCTDGSDEYVRFYVDYGGGWEDAGLASFNIHDLKFKEDLCYTVAVKLDPGKRVGCKDKPILPKVRAILSWEDIPAPNAPNWLPVWGNVLERGIQLDPWDILIGTFFDLKANAAVKIDPNLLSQLEKVVAEQPPGPKPPAPVAELLEVARKSGDELAELRVLTPLMQAAQKKKSAEGYKMAQDALATLEVDPSIFDGPPQSLEFNTSYEELHCVGLDRDADRLYAVIEIKRPYGYSGGLCTPGSKEYVAFYLDFGGGWDYQGTGSVIVHDIPQIPKDGLWYQVSIPVDLDKHRKEWCKTGRAKIRGILSWNTPPTPYDDDHKAPWGDWAECAIEIKPLPAGVPEKEFTPFLESIGNMSVAKIDASGYANGTSIGATFAAEDSPFGGKILLKGSVFNAPGPLEYQIVIDDLSGSGPLPFTDWFWAAVTTYPSITPVDVKQIATGGWFTYLPGPGVSVAGGLLGVLKGLADGPYDVQVHFRQAGSTTILASSATHRIMVDNKAPDVDIEITSGAGNCGKFAVGEVLLGTFEIDDPHCKSVTISVTPATEASGGLVVLKSINPPAPFPPPVPAPNARNGLTYDQTLNGAGLTTGEWELHTSAMDPCGYNIRVHGEDRTIVNSGHIGWDGWDIEGFCLE